MGLWALHKYCFLCLFTNNLFYPANLQLNKTCWLEWPVPAFTCEFILSINNSSFYSTIFWFLLYLLPPWFKNCMVGFGSKIYWFSIIVVRWRCHWAPLKLSSGWRVTVFFIYLYLIWTQVKAGEGHSSQHVFFQMKVSWINVALAMNTFITG